MEFKWYDCPACGKPDLNNGIHFCKACEEKYLKVQKEQELYLKEKQEKLARRAWIWPEGEEVEIIKESQIDNSIRVKYQTGKIKDVIPEWIESAEIPGGGLIIKIKKI